MTTAIKLIDVWIEGIRPVLIHRATEEALSGETRSNTAQERPNPRDICEEAVYRFPGTKQLGFPGEGFERMCREAGGSHKVKGSRKSVKYLVPAALIVLDELVPFFLKDRVTPVVNFEVDSRPVTIPSTKGRIMRHRARLNEWSAHLTCQLNESILSEGLLRQLFVEGLQQIGIGDYRPKFGAGSIVGWKVVSEQQTPQSAAHLHAAAA